jgi:hypothetical protein
MPHQHFEERRRMSMKEKVSISFGILSLVIALITVLGYVSKAAIIPTVMNMRIVSLEDRLRRREEKFDPLMDRQEKDLVELKILAIQNSEQHTELKKTLERIERKIDR